jgi:hypothetical protein
MNKAAFSGKRERACIAKENNFQQVCCVCFFGGGDINGRALSEIVVCVWGGGWNKAAFRGNMERVHIIRRTTSSRWVLGEGC